MRQVVHTNKAPQAIGNYSQAVIVSNTIYLSGQIPLDPATTALVEGDMKTQIMRIFENIKQILLASNSGLHEIVKLTVYLTDLTATPVLNEVMTHYFKKPFPARTTVQVVALPKNAMIEIDVIAMTSF